MQRLWRPFFPKSSSGTCFSSLRWTVSFQILLLATTLASAKLPATTQPPAWVNNLDGAAPVLIPLLEGSGFTLGQRTVNRQFFRYGSGSETIQLRGPAGRTAQLALELPSAPVIQELGFRADVATNRAGVQLAARIVLPRSENKATGRPFELLVRGGTIAAGGGWEELVLDSLPEKLAKHARVARAQYGEAMDERGAFVSQLVLLAPGGAGVTEIIVDRIRAFGAVAMDTGPATPTSAVNASAPSKRVQSRSEEGTGQSEIRIPRILQWQGESFQLVQKLGFNTLGMCRTPTEQELHQAEELGLALFCTPPPPDQLRQVGIAENWDSVLAWNLGEQLSAVDVDYVERWEQQVARADSKATRPTVLAPELHTLEASRMTDILLVGRATVGTQQTVREQTAWLTQRKRMARLGTPVWTKIETQPSSSQRLQVAALSGAATGSWEASYTQLAALTSASLGIKTSGFYFQSDVPLAVQDDASRRRSFALELTNLRLQLAEPWLFAGKEPSGARAAQPELSAIVLQAERSQLLVPIWWSFEFDVSIHPRSPGPVSFVVPGVSESSEAFVVTLGGMQRIPRKRVTGGVRVSLDDLPLDAFVMLSDDPQAIAQVTRFLRRIAPRATQLRRELAHSRIQQATELVARMSGADSDSSASQRLLQQARAELTDCDRALGAKNFYLAYLHADAVDMVIDALEAQLQSEANWSDSPQHTMLSLSAMSLPDRMNLLSRLARTPVSANRITGGGFENLEAMLESGWRHMQLPLDGITTVVQLSPESPHSGSYCLELAARSIDENGPTTIVPTAPVWITSSPLPVHAGDLVEITGVARITEPLLGSVDGLQVIDSIGGPDMALRIHDAPSWQPFRLIRAVTSDAQLTVTIALSGLGKAQVDDVAVRVVTLNATN